jgi:hypothetical protein
MKFFLIQQGMHLSKRAAVIVTLLGLSAGSSGCDRLESRLSESLWPSSAQSSLAQQPKPPNPPKSPYPSSSAGIVLSDRTLTPLSPHSVGMNLHVTQDASRPGNVEMLRRSKARIVRWPGGSESDHYQWRTHKLGFTWYPHPNSTFSSFMQKLVQPAQVDVAITLNYGSNAKGNGGGDPNEAAAWVAYAKSKGYRIAYWTVGNEVFGSWETDLNEKPHDAGTYAGKVAKAFYPKIKAVDPQAKVGVTVNQYEYDVNNPSGWTQTVLRQAKYDFVEFHYYPQTPDKASDEFLLNGAIAEFKKQVTGLQRVMGNRRVPIMLGEFNNVPSQPNKQTLSVVNALFHGLIFAEGAKLGLASMFPWETVEDYCTYAPQTGLKPNGNFSNTLYGWQTFATYSMFSLGTNSQHCKQGVSSIPYGTMFPSAHAASLFGEFAAPNERLLQTDVAQQYSKIRAYTASRGRGYRVLLFNLDRDVSTSLPLTLSQSGQWTAQQTTYGKAEYDQSRNNRWALPTRKTLGRLSSGAKVTLPPWSMSVISLDR